MSHTYVCTKIHAVFATAGRRPFLTATVRERVHGYLAGIGGEGDVVVHRVGGPEDHVHILFSLPSAMSVSKAMQSIKGGSSRWIHQTFPGMAEFAWQDGYGAFSVGASQIDDTISYLDRQVEHHRRLSYADEVRAFLARHGMAVAEHDHDL